MKLSMAAIPAWAVVVAAVLLIAMLVVVLVVLIRRRRAAAPRVPEGVEDMPARVREVFGSTRKALQTGTSDRVASFFAGRTAEAPDTGKRLLVFGLAGAGKTTALEQLAQGRTFAPALAAAPGSVVNLFRLDGAVAVEVAGRVLRDEDAKGQGGEAFQVVLQEMRRAFPDRPVDGIVVMLPLTPGLDEGPREEFVKEARRLRKRIDEAQRALAMRVPVYLLVTKCDALPSFGALGQEVGAARRQRILGWSRPERETEDPAADWVSEALGSMGAALTREQQRRFTAEPPISEASAGAYFLFPAHLSSAVSVSAFGACFDPIFHEKASGPPPDLRGIYFAGSAADVSPEAPILFVGDLVAGKVLPEANLAKPSPEAEKTRKRAILALRIASAVIAPVWGALLAFMAISLGPRTAGTRPFLDHLISDLVLVTAHATDLSENATGLLDTMPSMNTRRLRSYAAPTSLLSPIDRRVERSIAFGYEQVVLTAFRRRLEKEGLSDGLGPGELFQEDPGELGTSRLDRTPEYQRAAEWVRHLGEFSANADSYRRIVDAHKDRQASEVEIRAIADLSASLFKHKMGPEFSGNAKHYTEPINEPMDDIELLETAKLAPHAERDAMVVFDALHKRVYALNSGPVVPDDLEELLASFRELGDPTVAYTTKHLRRLQRAIANMEDHVGRDGLKWIPNDQVPPFPKEQRELYEKVDALQVLGRELGGRLREDARHKLDDLQKRLWGAKDPLLGPVLARKPGGERVEMKLAGRILSLREPTDAILRQPYMSGAEELSGQRELPVEINLPSEVQVEWEVDTLKGVAKVVKDYEAMLVDGPFDKFPVEEQVQDKVRELAKRRLAVWLHGLFNNNRAARRNGAIGAGPLPYQVLLADAQNFALAGAPLREILASLGRARVDETRDQVRAAVRGQGGRVLKSLSRSLDAENLYHASFGAWKGDGKPSAFAAFQVSDSAQLAEHVIDQRTRAEILAREVGAPVLAIMVSSEVGMQDLPDVTRWDRIVAALRDYEAKRAGNSVSTLEHFILTELPAITDLDKCLALDKSTSRGRDFFGERRRWLYDALRSRCLAISSDDMRDWYERLRLEFNRSLADRFPFTKNERSEDAIPEAARSFLASTGDFAKRYRKLLVDRGDGGSRDAVRFLDKAEDARLFLLPLWSQTETSEGAFDVRVDFRVNTGREIAGNEIAEWGLRLAEERLTMGGAKSSARWHIEDPVRVELRWADNSPDMPRSAQAPGIVASGRQVVVEGRGVWALLRIIAEYQTSLKDVESRNPASSMLAFTVRTIPDPQGGYVDRVGTDVGFARVFIRLTLSSTAKDKAGVVHFPDFPTRVPPL